VRKSRGNLSAMTINIWMLLLCLISANPNQGLAADSSAKDKHDVHKRCMKKEPIVSTEIRMVDENGRTRLILSANSGLPVVSMFGADGEVRLSMSLDRADYGSIKITSPNPTGPVAALELDDKGAHVKFDRPGGASSYLFLNNAGQSGTVFLDANGRRRLTACNAGRTSPDYEVRREEKPTALMARPDRFCVSL